MQTDFKTADLEVNTDQDIEKNLVSIQGTQSPANPVVRVGPCLLRLLNTKIFHRAGYLGPWSWGMSPTIH